MFAVKAILPSGAIATVKSGFRSHRDAMRSMHIRTADGRLLKRFGIRLFVGIAP